MAIAFVQVAKGNEGNNNGSVALTSVGAGNLLVFCCSYAGQDATPTVSGTNSNTFSTPVTVFNTDGSVTTDLMSYCISATAGNTTVTMNKTETDADSILMEFSGVASFDKSATIGASPGTTATPSYTISPTAGSELLVAHFGQEQKSETSVTPGTGFTTSSGFWNLNHFDAAEYNLSGSSGSNTVAMTVSPNAAVGWVSICMAFVASAGASGVTPQLMTMGVGF